jgi:hypothetical protein
MSSDLSCSDFFKSQAHLNNNNNGYDKIKVANGIQQISYISCSRSGVYMCILEVL